MACLKFMVFAFSVLYVKSSEDAKLLFGVQEGQHAGYKRDIEKARRNQDPVNIQQLRTEMRTEMANLRAKNDELETRLIQQEAYIQMSDKRFNEDISRMQVSLDQMISKFEEVKGRNSSRFGISLPISFSAYKMVQNLPYKIENQILVLDKELVNDGQGYDKSTGMFTAPISGVYVFSYYVVYDGYNGLKVSLDVEGKAMSISYKNTDDFVTGGSIVQLSKGDRVHLKFEGDADKWNIYWTGAGMSRFSGFLLYVS